MNANTTLFCLTLLLASTVIAQDENPPEYPTIVVGYGAELKAPFTWGGHGSDQLSIIDANGVKVPFYPSTRITKRELKSTSEDRLEVLRQRHRLHCEAAAEYRAKGYDAMIQVYGTKKNLVSRLTDLGNGEYIIHYYDGDEEALTEYGDSSGGVTRTQADVHDLLIKKFSDERERCESIWFGSDGYYIHYETTAEDIALYYAAVSNLKAGITLTEEDLNTPAGDSRVQRDIRK